MHGHNQYVTVLPLMYHELYSVWDADPSAGQKSYDLMTKKSDPY